MTEIKPGKWRLKDGREVVVLYLDDNGTTARVLFPLDSMTSWWPMDRLEDAEYLGPAVIGESEPDDMAYWVMLAREYEQKYTDSLAEVASIRGVQEHCEYLEAETVATRELLEKSEERCEELANKRDSAEKTCTDLRSALGRRSDSDVYWRQQAEDSGRRIRELEDRCEKLLDSKALKSSGVDEIAVHRYKSVTVMVRGEREASARKEEFGWAVRDGDGEEIDTYDPHHRKAAEDDAIELLKPPEPRWREATVGDRGKACRCRDSDDQDWLDVERLVAVIDHEIRFVTISDGCGEPAVWRYCEVQD